MTRSTLRLLLLLGILAAAGVLAWMLLGRHGRGSPGGSAPVLARDTWRGTFDAAMDALARHDRAALVDLLTPSARATLDLDLTRFAQGLADPVRGPRLLGKVREAWAEVPDALVEGARAARLDDVWTLFLRATTPPGVRPVLAGMRLVPGQTESVEALYRYGDGTELPIVLVRQRERWSVDRLTVGSS